MFGCHTFEMLVTGVSHKMLVTQTSLYLLLLKGPTVHPPVLHYKQKLAFLGIYTLILWFMIIFELKGVFAINHMH